MAIIRVAGSHADLDIALGMSVNTALVDTNIAKEGFISSTTTLGRLNLASPLTDFWFNMRGNIADLTNVSSYNVASFYDTTFSTTQALFRLIKIGRMDTDGNFKASYWNGSAWTNVGTGVLSESRNFEESVHIKIDNTTGDFSRYRNTALDGQLTGDTLFTAGTAIDRIEFDGNTGTAAMVWSEIIIADEDTRGMRLQKLNPTADGATSSWTNGFAAIDENGIDDTDFIVSASANQVETYTVGDIDSTLSGFAVKAVIMSARARKGGTGPQNLQGAVRLSGTNFFSSNIAGLNTIFQGARQAIWAVDPNTTAAWTQAAVNGAEIGVKSIA